MQKMEFTLKEISKEITQAMRSIDMTLDQLDKMEEDTIKLINESRKTFRTRTTKLQSLNVQIQTTLLQYNLNVFNSIPENEGDNNES